MIEVKDGRLLLRAAGQVRPKLTARPAESVPSVTKIHTTFNTVLNKINGKDILSKKGLYTG